MCSGGKMRKKWRQKIFFIHSWSHRRKESDPEPDQLVKGTDPGIRIRTKMSRIPNTGKLITIREDQVQGGLRQEESHREKPVLHFPGHSRPLSRPSIYQGKTSYLLLSAVDLKSAVLKANPFWHHRTNPFKIQPMTSTVQDQTNPQLWLDQSASAISSWQIL